MIILSAPNIHTGGGFVLLQYLLQSWPANIPMVAYLDIRAKDYFQLPCNARIEWVRPTLFSRLKAEIKMAAIGLSGDCIICFNGLPPLFPNKARVHIYQQNRLYLGLISLNEFSWRTRLRLGFEKAAAYIFRTRCDVYWVQTPSMAHDLKKWYGDKPVCIRVLPFSKPPEKLVQHDEKIWDFCYVADGEAHKNHRRLVASWVILAAHGYRPSLALTLGKRDGSLLSWLQEQIALHDLRITNLGHLPHDELLCVYGQTKALIFPSLIESFGLPLIEAREAGLPILASELDYVRDVCEPVQTFDPNSPTSIARAVNRLIGHADITIKPVEEKLFLN
jgi:glycosyltransferase involved in cell wall biosynthesis